MISSRSSTRWSARTRIATRYREFADMRHFPDWKKIYAALGIRDVGGHLHLDSDAPDAALRDAIMAPRAASKD